MNCQTDPKIPKRNRGSVKRRRAVRDVHRDDDASARERPRRGSSTIAGGAGGAPFDGETTRVERVGGG